VILAGNAQAVREVLQDFRAQLDRLLSGLDLDRESWFNPAVGAINQVMTAGNEGVARIPGKHGDAASKYGTVSVLIPDEPGFLGRLFAEIGDAGINIEDFRLEHSLGQAQGLATIYVVPASVEPLCEHLQRRGWSVANL
jgi:prephenate dehydrogenase